MNIKDIYDRIKSEQDKLTAETGELLRIAVSADGVAVSGYVAERYETDFGATIESACERFKARLAVANPPASELRRRAAEMMAKAEAMEAGK